MSKQYSRATTCTLSRAAEVRREPRTVTWYSMAAHALLLETSDLISSETMIHVCSGSKTSSSKLDVGPSINADSTASSSIHQSSAGEADAEI